MISSLIYTDLAADRRHNLIAVADAHRFARLARPARLRSRVGRARSQRTVTTAPLRRPSCGTVPTR
jgi:hypothetical protein